MNSANFRLMLAAAFLLALEVGPLAQAQFRQGTGTTTPPRSLPPSGERTFTHSGTYTRSGPSGRAGSGTYSGQVGSPAQGCPTWRRSAWIPAARPNRTISSRVLRAAAC